MKHLVKTTEALDLNNTLGVSDEREKAIHLLTVAWLAVSQPIEHETKKEIRLQAFNWILDFFKDEAEQLVALTGFNFVLGAIIADVNVPLFGDVPSRQHDSFFEVLDRLKKDNVELSLENIPTIAQWYQNLLDGERQEEKEGLEAVSVEDENGADGDTIR